MVRYQPESQRTKLSNTGSFGRNRHGASPGPSGAISIEEYPISSRPNRETAYAGSTARQAETVALVLSWLAGAAGWSRTGSTVQETVRAVSLIMRHYPAFEGDFDCANNPRWTSGGACHTHALDIHRSSQPREHGATELVAVTRGTRGVEIDDQCAPLSIGNRWSAAG